MAKEKLAVREGPGENHTPLVIRKLADTSVGDRVRAFLVPLNALVVDEEKQVALIYPEHLDRILFNPETPDLEHEGWPLAGVEFAGDIPVRTSTSQNYLKQAEAEGWVTLYGKKVVHRPGGPQHDPWSTTHTFVQCERVVFHTVDGDITYRVVENPDKWPATHHMDDENKKIGFGGEVNWNYILERYEEEDV